MSDDAHAEARRRRPTQIDIARVAGVSQTTVSLVLNNPVESLTRIPAETRQRVLAAVEELGYSPNPAARSLVGGRNYLLGFHTFEAVFPSDQSDFYFPFLLGVEREATRQGYDLLLFSPASQARPGAAATTSRLRLADGCVLLGRHVDRAGLADLARNDFPVVFIGRREIPEADIPYVGVDYETATRQLVERLVAAGHRTFGYIGEPGGGEQSHDRLKGYQDALAALPEGHGSVKHSKPLTADELRGWVQKRGITAVLVEPGEDDSNVLALERTAAEIGLAIPGDLSVAVVGDPAFTTTTRADWTRFSIERAEIGQRAVHLLVAILDGEAAERHVLVAPTLVDGATTGSPRQQLQDSGT